MAGSIPVGAGTPGIWGWVNQWMPWDCIKAYYGVPPDQGGQPGQWVDVTYAVWYNAYEAPYFPVNNNSLLFTNQPDPAPYGNKIFVCTWDERVNNGPGREDSTPPGGCILFPDEVFVLPPGMFRSFANSRSVHKRLEN